MKNLRLIQLAGKKYKWAVAKRNKQNTFNYDAIWLKVFKSKKKAMSYIKKKS
jgi:hypothetical protein